MRSFNSAKGSFVKFSYLIILSLALFGLIAPLPSHASLSGPFGEVQLSMYQINTRPVGGRAPLIYAYGAVSIGGSWYYVNNSAVTSSTSVSKSGGAFATNTSASASASSSSSTSVTATTSSEIPAPLKLVGSVTFFYSGGSNETVPMEFTKNEYYVGELANFTTMRVRPGFMYYSYTVVPETLNGTPIGPVLTGIEGQGFALIDLYNTIIALPQFNDSMLEAYATSPSQEYPALPLGPYYNLLMVVAIIVLIPIAFLDLLSSDERKRTTLLGVLKKISAGILIMLIFPFLYDKIAYLMNTLNTEILAYPVIANQQASWVIAQENLANLEAYMIFPSTVTAITVLETGLLAVGYFVVAVIVWIMSYMLGTVRILLLAGMIAMFPLSLALRDFHYTQKLGRIIEDTLFGLMLASILSSVMLSVATYLLQNWNSSANMFRLAGIQPQWVAITAVLTAMVAVTILAPYTSATYQIVSETGMVAGGVASAMWLGALSGGIQGYMGNASPFIGEKVMSGIGSAFGGGATHFVSSGLSAVSGKHSSQAVSHFTQVMRTLTNTD
jgi:hypothetical protein